MAGWTNGAFNYEMGLPGSGDYAIVAVVDYPGDGGSHHHELHCRQPGGQSDLLFRTPLERPGPSLRPLPASVDFFLPCL